MAPRRPSLEDLQEEWKHLYQHSLPSAAKAKAQSQPTWPVHNDHCFARIILDSVVGITTPWTAQLKSPAYKNMSRTQLEASIDLGEQILIGEVNLVELDERSLVLRGKSKGTPGQRREGWMAKRSVPPVDLEALKREANEARRSKRMVEQEDEGEEVQANKRRRVKVEERDDDDDDDSDDTPLCKSRGSSSRKVKKEDEEAELPEEASTRSVLKDKTNSQKTGSKPHNIPPHKEPTSTQTITSPEPQIPPPHTSSQSTPTPSTPTDLTPYLKKIALSSKTPFQKRVLNLICQVPPGQYTTYGAISKHLSSSPRAVGNALRNNPFAPHVPCHRILATGGGIGGFHGSWGKNGQAGLNDDKKRKLLRDEGVRFDGKGKVVGRAWEGFK